MVANEWTYHCDSEMKNIRTSFQTGRRTAYNIEKFVRFRAYSPFPSRRQLNKRS